MFYSYVSFLVVTDTLLEDMNMDVELEEAPADPDGIQQGPTSGDYT